MSKIAKIISGICATALAVGVVVVANQNLPALAETSPQVQVENNKMVRNNIGFEITKVNFTIGGNKDSKLAEVYITIENTKGRNQAMSPKGAIVGMVGSSGKTYDIVTKDEAVGIDYSLDVGYKETEMFRKDLAKKQNKTFEPGVFLVAPGVMVDMDEENIAAVIYQDENGNKNKIPIVGITPTTTELSGEGK